jgi:WD40 repeat protein
MRRRIVHPLICVVGFAALAPAVAAQPAVKPPPDPFGHPLPKHAIYRLGTPGMRHNDEVQAVAYSPDGKLFASCDRKSVRVWDAATGKLIRVIRDEQVEWLSRLEFSPDGKLLAAAGHRWLLLVEVGSGKVLHRLDHGEDHTLVRLRFAADGKTVAAACYRYHEVGNEMAQEVRYYARVWDTATGKQRGAPPAIKEARIQDLALSPDGSGLILVLDNAKLIRWSLADDKSESRQLAKVSKNYSAVLSADGTLLASRRGKDAVRVQRLTDGKTLLELDDPEKDWQPVLFSPDRRLLFTEGYWSGLVAWDIATGKAVGEKLPRSSGRSPPATDGKSVAYCYLHSPFVRVVDLTTGKDRYRVPSLGRLTEAYFAKDATTVVTLGPWSTWEENDLSVRFWDRASGKPQGGKMATEAPGNDGLIIRPQGDLAAFRSYGDEVHKLELWDVAAGKVARSLLTGKQRLLCMAFSPDGSRLAAVFGDLNLQDKFESKNNALHVWEVATGKEVRGGKLPDQFVSALAFSPDNNSVVLARGIFFEPGGPFELVFWDIKTGKNRIVRRNDTATVSRLLFSPDGRLLVFTGLAYDDTALKSGVHVYEVASGAPIWRAPGVWGHVYPLTPRPAEDHGYSEDRVLFAPDGRTLIATHYDDVRFWEPTTGKVRGQLAGHLGPVTSLALAPDGRTLLTASADHTAILWDVADFLSPPPVPARQLTDADWQSCWDRLAGRDAAQAYAALDVLRASPAQTVKWLKESLRPVAPLDARAAAKHLAALSAEQQAERNQATAALEAFGDPVAPLLRQQLAEAKSLEVKRRIEQLVAKLDPDEPGTEVLRGHRAVALLESLETPAADQLLQALAAGAPAARLTREAQVALRRRKG